MRGLYLRSIFCLAPLILSAQDLREFEKQVTEFTLPNGLHFILAERHQAPVLSFHTYVRAGSVDDPSGQTGLAHMFERLAFKGTEAIGTQSWVGEKQKLAAIEEAYDRMEAERNKGPKADDGALRALEAQVKVAITEAEILVVPDEYNKIFEENLATGLNAHAGLDSTEYICTLPSNRLELWFLMESQRFLRPAFREFYKERDRALEEYRVRVESNPRAKLLQALTATAFAAHPYRNPSLGWPSDILSLRGSQAKAFFDEYYVPANMSISIAGDVNPADARRLADKYFGGMKARPLPPVVHTAEPPQAGQKIAAVSSAGEPMVVIGYKRPDQYDPDDPVFDILQAILANPRTGMLYQEMVQAKKIALAAQAAATYPNGRYPSLFAFYLAPSPGHTIQENQKTLDDLLTRLAAAPVSPVALARAKSQLRAGMLRRLAGNPEVASLLNTYYGSYGDWRKVFKDLDGLNQVTAGDVERVARKYFVPESRTIAYTAAPGGLQ